MVVPGHNIEITVKPSQSAFYAGEPFTCEITFRNIRPPPVLPLTATSNGQLSPTKSLGGLKRGHRSVQSLNTEAMSAGVGASRVPSTPLTASHASTSALPLPTRKGLIGHDRATAEQSPPRSLQPNGLYGGKRRLPLDVGHKRHNYSVAHGSSPDLLSDLSAQQVAHDQLHQPRKPSSRTPSLAVPSITEEEPTPRLGGLNDSPVSTRSDTTTSPTLSPTHWRSKSLLEAQTEALADAFDEIDVDAPPSRASMEHFYAQGHNESIDALWRDRVTDLAHPSRRPSSNNRLPLSRRTSASSSATPSYSHAPSSATLSRFPTLGLAYPASAPPWDPRFPAQGTQTLLWTFAQLQGTFEVDESLVKPGEFIAVKRTLFGGLSAPQRHGPRTSAAGLVGGGSLAASHGSMGESGTGGAGGPGWREWFWGSGEPPNTTRASGSTLEDRRSRAMNDRSVPVLSMPPSILAVDLSLEPGESKTYTYTLSNGLPADLPPSYRGKAIRFTYTVLVGCNRAPDALAGETQPESRLVRVPIRVYNNVAFSGARPFYDLTNPVVWYRDEASTSSPDDPKVVTRARRRSNGRAELEAYATRLLSSVFASPELGGPAMPPAATPSLDYASRFGSPLVDGGPASRPEMRPRTTSTTSSVHSNPDPELGEADDAGGCKAAVEVVSRNSQKASYDINKDGYPVATLILVKTAFRLGETVHGVLVVNTGTARVLRVAARLETHELIETSISTLPAPKVRQTTRRTHAEHHEAALDTARVPIALAIPSGAAPDFATSGVKLQWSLRLSFLVMPQPAPLPLSTTSLSPTRPGGHARQASTLHPASRTAALAKPQHVRSKSLSTPSADAQAAIVDPVAVSNGSHHLLPAHPLPTPGYTAYKAVPDLTFSPVLFRSGVDAAFGGQAGKEAVSAVNGSTVLMPTKVEVVECSIPIKMYPSSTAYRPAVSQFTL